MARKINAREVLLLAVLAAALFAALYMGRGAGLGSGDAAANRDKRDLPTPPVIDMTSLDRGAAIYDPEGRSLFKYYVPPVKAAPPKKIERRPPPPKPKPRPQPVERKPPPPRKPAAPKPPVISFTYIGTMGPKENKIAVFEKPDQEIVIARQGELVEEEFKVVSFKFDGVTMGYTDPRFKDQTTDLEAKN